MPRDIGELAPFSCEMQFFLWSNQFNDQLPSRSIKIENPSGIEILIIEITIRKNKILVSGIYKPPDFSETDFTASLETIIGKLPNRYQK